MAVPHVSGTVSLLLYLKRHLNPEQVRYLLTQSADKNAGNHPERLSMLIEQSKCF